MDGDTLGRLAYLVLLGAVILGWFLVQNRGRLGSALQQAFIWGLIFVGVAAAYGLWSDMRFDQPPRQSVISGEGRVEVPRSPDGHYYLELEVEGAAVRFVVDTGATDMVLSQRDARRIGLDPDALSYQGRARTANGIVRTARVRIEEIRLGDFVDHGVTAWVNEGEMDISLLGMSYLQRFASIEIARDRLVLRR